MNRRLLRSLAGLLVTVASGTQVAQAQIVIDGMHGQLTVEGYANVVTGDDVGASVATAEGDHFSVDAALRALALHRSDVGLDIGLRIAAESSEEDRFDFGEASVLLVGKAGRLEIGERQGLPDVLTGYAPNNFTFTSAEFGPASGPSLDPAGGLQPRYVDAPIAAQLRELSVLGYASSLADDRSGKVLYVSRKTRGFLGGLSYAPDADDARFEDLLQAGLTHETYWDQNVLRVGGSISWARGQATGPDTRVEDLSSFNAGVTLVLDDALTLGLSATWNGDGGLERIARTSASAAGGWVASANYNVGPWTLGGYYQRARAEGDVAAEGDDRLEVFEAGLSWRLDTRTRFFVAWYAYRFDEEASARYSGDVVLAGFRLTL